MIIYHTLNITTTILYNYIFMLILKINTKKLMLTYNIECIIVKLWKKKKPSDLAIRRFLKVILNYNNLELLGNLF